jgi:hypothetical protein
VTGSEQPKARLPRSRTRQPRPSLVV